MRCKTCDYSLKSLTEHRCPECGTPFDPNDPTTFETDDQTQRSISFGIFLVCLILIYLGFWTYAVIWGVPD